MAFLENHLKPGRLRFYGQVVVGAALLLGWIMLVSFIDEKIPGPWGTALAVLGGSSFFLGLWLAYQNLVDWSNLAIIRRCLGEQGDSLRDGQVLAFEGSVASDEEPLLSPFSERPCSAYSYRVASSASTSRGSRTLELASGQHLLPTRIEGREKSLSLLAFPGLEDDLRLETDGRDYSAQITKLFERIADAPASGQSDREAALQQARQGPIERLALDYHLGNPAKTGAGLDLTEELLPIGETVCVLGTYEKDRAALSARRGRIGPNLMVYLGSKRDVLKRVGQENRKYFRISAYMMGTGLIVVATAVTHPYWSLLTTEF